MRIHFEKLLNAYGMNDLIPVDLEKGALNLYLNQEVKSEESYSVNYAELYLEKEIQQSGTRVWQSSALVSSFTSLSRDAVPTGRRNPHI